MFTKSHLDIGLHYSVYAQRWGGIGQNAEIVSAADCRTFIAALKHFTYSSYLSVCWLGSPSIFLIALLQYIQVSCSVMVFCECEYKHSLYTCSLLVGYCTQAAASGGFGVAKYKVLGRYITGVNG